MPDDDALAPMAMFTHDGAPRKEQHGQAECAEVMYAVELLSPDNLSVASIFISGLMVA